MVVTSTLHQLTLQITLVEIVNVLTEMGFEVEASHHEVAVGQHEIDFKYADVLKACDNIQIFKLVVKQLLVNMVFTLHSWLSLNLVSTVQVCTVTCHCSITMAIMPSYDTEASKRYAIANCQKQHIISLAV